MVLADPVEPSSSTAPAYTEGLQVGDCITDTLQSKYIVNAESTAGSTYILLLGISRG